jgi:hypothetical protein
VLFIKQKSNKLRQNFEFSYIYLRKVVFEIIRISIPIPFHFHWLELQFHSTFTGIENFDSDSIPIPLYFQISIPLPFQFRGIPVESMDSTNFAMTIAFSRIVMFIYIVLNLNFVHSKHSYFAFLTLFLKLGKLKFYYLYCKKINH